MASKRKRRAQRKSSPSRDRPRRHPVFAVATAVIAFAVTVVILGLVVLPYLAPPPEIPLPDASSMEPQVAEAITRAREQVVENPRDPARWGELGMVFHAHELFREAAYSYAQARRLDEGDSRWPYLEAQALTPVQELARAREALAAALAVKDDYAPLYVLKAQLSERAGDEEGARDAYRRAQSIDASSAVAAFGLGRLALSSGELEESRAQLERARDLQPEAGAIRASLARLYRRQGRGEEARREAQAARELDPAVVLDDPVMAAVAEAAVSLVGLQERASAAEARGDTRAAERLLERMIELRPEEPNLHYNLANFLSRQGRLEEATTMFREALALDPGHTGALVNLGLIEAQGERLDQAAALFERALDEEPEHAAALASLGKIAAGAGELQRATALLERAAEREPRAETFYALSQVLLRAGHLDRAIDALERAVAASPGTGSLHFELAIAYAERGDFPRAWAEVNLAEKSGFTVPADFLRALHTRYHRRH